MVDYIALMKAHEMVDRPMMPGAKMSGGDQPLWDADMDFWLNDDLTIHFNFGYRCSKVFKEVSGEITLEEE